MTRFPGRAASCVLALVMAAVPSVAAADGKAARTEALRAYGEQRFAACGTAFDRLSRRDDGRDTDAYNAACCHARAGDHDAALASLDRATTSGMDDLLQVETDPDLATLRADPRWPAALARIRAAHERQLATLHRELAQLYRDDQADRTGTIDWVAMAARDQVRLARARALVAAGAPRVADDFFHAAMLFQHGKQPDDYRMARRLARRAVALEPGHRLARWLASAAHDRHQWAIGKPQVYGTQSHRVNGVWTLEPIRRTAVSDAERVRWGVPPLAEAEAQAAAMTASDRAAEAPVPSVTRPAGAVAGSASRSGAMRAYNEKRYGECAAHYDRLATEVGTSRDADAYNAACCHALAGDVDAAFTSLETARRNGLRDVLQVEKDPDLSTLRADPRWQVAIDRIRADRDRYLATVHRELAQLHADDQADRTGAVDWTVVAPRDKARRARVAALIAAGAARVADDYYHAAMVFQHGESAADYRQARTLARKAVALAPGHGKARWLAAAAHDRYLWKLGKPQVYGTQFHTVDGAWTIEPIQRQGVSDAERGRWGVRPVVEAEALAASMTARDRDAAPVPSATRPAARP